MIVRIVKMTFIESRIDDFKKFVKAIEPTIRCFRGCRYLEILQDIHYKSIFFSYSHWESVEDLNHYRNSEFFKETWSTVTKWFKSNPQAWSTEKL